MIDWKPHFSLTLWFHLALKWTILGDQVSRKGCKFLNIVAVWRYHKNLNFLTEIWWSVYLYYHLAIFTNRRSEINFLRGTAWWANFLYGFFIGEWVWSASFVSYTLLGLPKREQSFRKQYEMISRISYNNFLNRALHFSNCSAFHTFVFAAEIMTRMFQIINKQTFINQEKWV